MVFKIFRFLDKIFAILLTALLWYLQEYKSDSPRPFTKFLTQYKFDVALYGLLITLLIAIIVYIYEAVKKRNAIDSWAKSFMEHIIAEHLSGGNWKTRITIFKPQKGYKLILSYIFIYPIKAFLMTDYKINGQAFWTNIPYKLFSDYLAIYSRICFSNNKDSFTHFKITNRTDKTYNGIADKCYREQVECSVSTDFISHDELSKSYKNTNRLVKKYMEDSYIDKKYYATLRSMNTIPNNMYAIPIFYRNQKIWGVMIIDSNTCEKIDYSRILEEYIAYYQNIFSFTIQILE